MAKVLLKLLKLLDTEDSEIIAVVDVPEFSETTIILDRDHMGKVVVKESEAKPDNGWTMKVHKLEAMMNVLEGLVAKTSAQSQRVYGAIQEVKDKS